MTVSPEFIFFAVIYVVLGLAAWSLRPQQLRPISSRWFIGGKQDSFFRLLFNEGGRPRTYAWCAPIIVGVLLVPAIAWFLSDA